MILVKPRWQRCTSLRAGRSLPVARHDIRSAASRSSIGCTGQSRQSSASQNASWSARSANRKTLASSGFIRLSTRSPCAVSAVVSNDGVGPSPRSKRRKVWALTPAAAATTDADNPSERRRTRLRGPCPTICCPSASGQPGTIRLRSVSPCPSSKTTSNRKTVSACGLRCPASTRTIVARGTSLARPNALCDHPRPFRSREIVCPISSGICFPEKKCRALFVMCDVRAGTGVAISISMAWHVANHPPNMTRKGGRLVTAFDTDRRIAAAYHRPIRFFKQV